MRVADLHWWKVFLNQEFLTLMKSQIRINSYQIYVYVFVYICVFVYVCVYVPYLYIHVHMNSHTNEILLSNEKE